MSEGYKLYGGTGVEIEPLEVSEDGTYTAPMGKAFNPVKVSGGGSTGGGVMVVNVAVIEDQPTMDKTWQEINDFIEAGGVVFSPALVDESETSINYVCGLNSDVFSVYIISFGSDGTGTRVAFTAESADGYPVYDGAG